MEKIEPQKINVTNEITLYYTGPSLEKGAMPSLFYFALSGQDSLAKDPFNQIVQFLSKDQLRIFSMTLPAHQPPLRPENALQGWAADFTQGKDPIEAFLQDVQTAFDYLERNNLVNEKMAVAGLSRGGLIALLVAKRAPQIPYILTFAPVTSLANVKEFKEIADSPEVAKYEAKNLVSFLSDRSIRIYIGNRDERVSTHLCFSFVEEMVEEAFSQGIRSPRVELTLFPSIGHKGHGTPPEIFKAGADWIEEVLYL